MNRANRQEIRPFRFYKRHSSIDLNQRLHSVLSKKDDTQMRFVFRKLDILSVTEQLYFVFLLSWSIRYIKMFYLSRRADVYRVAHFFLNLFKNFFQYAC